MKKLNLLLTLFVTFFSIQSHATSWAMIHCSYDRGGSNLKTYNNPDGTNGIKVIEHKTSWDLVYDQCSDGENKYSLTFKVNKILNLDFLLDKGMNGEGGLKLTCVGTEITGTYSAGLVVGLGLIASGEIGGFVSVLNGQAGCLLMSGETLGLGVEVSPEMLTVKKLN